MEFIKSLVTDRAGATAAEYAMILAIVGTGVALAAVLLGESIAGAMNATSTCISSRVCC